MPHDGAGRLRTARTPQRLADAWALLALLARYWLLVYPRVRRELRRWRRHAAAIPDPCLRRHAGETLGDEAGLSEGAAIFAAFGPWRGRRRLIRLLVAFQVLYDYLDTLTEQPTPDPLTESRRLYRALAAALGFDAVEAAVGAADSLRDGGYVSLLVRTCHATFRRLPAIAAVEETVRHAVARSAEGQCLNHAAMLTGDERSLAAWSRCQASAEVELWWWELAAAASSSLALHSLFAAAADPRTSAAEALHIDRVYFPTINAASTLLDGLIDRLADEQTGNHCFIDHYASTAIAAERLAMISRHALLGARQLPHGRAHAIVFAAMVCFYLSSPHATLSSAQPVSDAILAELDLDAARTLMALMRLRQRLGSEPRPVPTRR
jgi:tetraprenyl-beta-curcumene synthase